ncbi:unnamed protein product, partial [Dicrocoelium dendriticum]
MISHTVQPSDKVTNFCAADRDPDAMVHNLRKLIKKSQIPASFVRLLMEHVKLWMPFLPKDYWTLRRTPRNFRIQK